MESQKVTHSTFVIERNYAASPERVFDAFADPAKKRRWFAEDKGMAIEEFELDFRVGGTERARYRMLEGTPFPGASLGNDTSYHDILPGRRIVLAYTMSLGDRRISASLATIEIVPAGKGTDLIFTEQGAYFEGSDGPHMRENGWRELLDKLEKEVGG
jgi:uncharacterized protein YndB with AHSA1/START domain